MRKRPWASATLLSIPLMLGHLSQARADTDDPVEMFRQTLGDRALPGKLVLKEASAVFDVHVTIQYCGDGECLGEATVELLRKGDSTPFQKISAERVYLEPGRDADPTAGTPIELRGDNDRNVAFDDFNFDGRVDLALRDGNDGTYGGRSYDVWLYSPSSRQFVKHVALTELASHTLGFFQVDHDNALIVTADKSGCCRHWKTSYRIDGDAAVKVRVETEEVIYDRTHVLTVKELSDGRWQEKVVRTETAVPTTEGNERIRPGLTLGDFPGPLFLGDHHVWDGTESLTVKRLPQETSWELQYTPGETMDALVHHYKSKLYEWKWSEHNIYGRIEGKNELGDSVKVEYLGGGKGSVHITRREEQEIPVEDPKDPRVRFVQFDSNSIVERLVPMSSLALDKSLSVPLMRGPKDIFDRKTLYEVEIADTAEGRYEKRRLEYRTRETGAACLAFYSGALEETTTGTDDTAVWVKGTSGDGHLVEVRHDTDPSRPQLELQAGEALVVVAVKPAQR